MCITTPTTIHWKKKTKRIPTKIPTKQWKIQLQIHHDTHKIMYITRYTNNWRIHLIITNIPQNIPKPPEPTLSLEGWIKELANMDKKNHKVSKKNSTNSHIQKTLQHIQKH
jgi:hypothetical protein